VLLQHRDLRTYFDFGAALGTALGVLSTFILLPLAQSPCLGLWLSFLFHFMSKSYLSLHRSARPSVHTVFSPVCNACLVMRFEPANFEVVVCCGQDDARLCDRVCHFRLQQIADTVTSRLRTAPTYCRPSVNQGDSCSLHCSVCCTICRKSESTKSVAAFPANQRPNPATIFRAFRVYARKCAE